MMDAVSDFLVTYLDSIDERLLEGPNQDDGVHGPLASLARRPGVVHSLPRSVRPRVRLRSVFLRPVVMGHDGTQ